MGASHTWTCTKCEKTLRTSGPWEFYRDPKGRRRDYGHPNPRSKEAEQAGVAGFSGKVLCPRCGRVSDCILVEFEPDPGGDYPLGAWLGSRTPLKKYQSGHFPYCHKCGSRELLLEPPGTPVSCPFCRKGVLEAGLAWIS